MAMTEDGHSDPNRDQTRRSDGLGMAEYALVLVLIAVVAIAALTNVGALIERAFCAVAATLGGSC